MTLGIDATVLLDTPFADVNGAPTYTESFVTIEQYMQATGATITPGSTEEAKIEFALAAACGEVRLYTEQLLDYVVGDEVVVDGTGTTWLVLPQGPVTAINSVVIDEGLDTEQTITDWKLHADAATLYRRRGWKHGVNIVTINYDHGFPIMPTALVNIPIQMTRAAIAVSPGGIVSESIMGYSYSRGEVTTGIEEYARALDRYKLPRNSAY